MSDKLWEGVADGNTERLVVPGGWLYRTFFQRWDVRGENTQWEPSGLVFVPDPSSADAVARERSRCAALARTIGDDDAEPHSAREVAHRIAAEIEGGS